MARFEYSRHQRIRLIAQKYNYSRLRAARSVRPFSSRLIIREIDANRQVHVTYILLFVLSFYPSGRESADERFFFFLFFSSFSFIHLGPPISEQRGFYCERGETGRNDLAILGHRNEREQTSLFHDAETKEIKAHPAVIPFFAILLINNNINDMYLLSEST